MFKKIVRFSIRKKLFVVLTTLFLMIGGIYSMLTLPIDAVPDITNNQVQIVTVSPTGTGTWRIRCAGRTGYGTSAAAGEI